MNPMLLDGARLLPDRLAMLDVLPKGACVAEIGVASGAFSAEILARTRPKALHLIDPWDQFVDAYSAAAFRKIQEERRSEIEAGIVRLHRGYSTDVLSEFPDDYFDWVYLDAAHDYDNVAQDLKGLHRKVKHKGLICGHDYTQWSSPADRYGVVEAVNEFVNRTSSHLLYLTNQADRQDSFVVQLNKAAGSPI